MTQAERLFSILTDLDDDLIEEAALPALSRRRTPALRWRRWAALAACLVLAVGIWRFFPRMGSSEAPNEAEPPGAASPMDAPPTADRDGSYGASIKPIHTSDPASPAESPDAGGAGSIFPYDLTSNEITVYTPVPDLWLTTRVTDKAAKRLCTLLTISEPGSAEPPGEVPTAWLDFENGTVVCLLPGDYAAVYRWETEFSPPPQIPAESLLEGVFPGLEDTLRQVLENPAETWDTPAEVSSTPD